MEIPENTKTYDLRASTIWFDEKGILYLIPKPNVSAKSTKEETEKDIARIKKITGDKKVCMVLEASNNSNPPKKEDRDLIADQLDKLVKAMAIIVTSPLSRMVANLFFGLRPSPYPIKMFTDEKKAREWITQYA